MKGCVLSSVDFQSKEVPLLLLGSTNQQWPVFCGYICGYNFSAGLSLGCLHSWGDLRVWDLLQIHRICVPRACSSVLPTSQWRSPLQKCLKKEKKEKRKERIYGGDKWFPKWVCIKTWAMLWRIPRTLNATCWDLAARHCQHLTHPSS